MAPLVTWTDETGAVLASSTDTSQTLVESRLNLTMMYPWQVIATTMHFEGQLKEDLPDYIDAAVNAPIYTKNWTTTPDLALGLRTLLNNF